MKTNHRTLRFTPVLLALACITAVTTPALRAQTVTEDALLFTIEKFPIEHQGPQVIDLKARLDYKLDIGPKEYPDFEEVYRKLVEWMNAYPNETDYWEPFNRVIAKKVLEAYPMVVGVRFELIVYPTYGIQYSHSSIVTLKRE